MPSGIRYEPVISPLLIPSHISDVPKTPRGSDTGSAWNSNYAKEAGKHMRGLVWGTDRGLEGRNGACDAAAWSKNIISILHTKRSIGKRWTFEPSLNLMSMWLKLAWLLEKLRIAYGRASISVRLVIIVSDSWSTLLLSFDHISEEYSRWLNVENHSESNVPCDTAKAQVSALIRSKTMMTTFTRKWFFNALWLSRHWYFRKVNMMFSTSFHRYHGLVYLRRT